MRELPILPRGVVIIPRSEEISCPWKDQEMMRGWSPLVTMQDTWANEPSSITSWPKLRGSKLGGSDEKIKLVLTIFQWKKWNPPVPSQRPITVHH